MTRVERRKNSAYRIAELEAENERLRIALKDLCDRIDFEVESKRISRMVSGIAPGRCEWVEYQRARQALEETT